MQSWLRRAALPAALFSLTSLSAAHAVIVNHADWQADIWTWCTGGINSRTCTVSFSYDTGCTEAAVMGMEINTCRVSMQGSVRVVTNFNSAGRAIGCGSVPEFTPSSGSVSFDSADDAFDNPNISREFYLRIFDSFGDKKTAVAQLLARDLGENQNETNLGWVVKTEFLTTCAPNDVTLNSAVGTVDVQI